MKKEMASFLSGLLAFAAAIFLAWFWLQSAIPERFYYRHAWALMLFFFVVTAIFHSGLLSAAAKSGSGVIRYYMMSTAVKLMLYFIVMVGYILLRPGSVLPFVTNFFVLYILFTAFEVTVAYRFFRGRSGPLAS